MAREARISTEVIQVDPRTLKLLERNARFMTHEQFQRLVSNVKRDGKLTSVPFAWKDEEGDWEVLSGNHRVAAAIEAGIEEIDVMVTEDRLTKAQRLAIQLSHNAITGQDDLSLLTQIYGEIDDLDMRAYTGLDDASLQLLPDVDMAGIGELGLNVKPVLFLFMPHEVAKLEEVLDEVQEMVKDESVTHFIANLPEHRRLLEAMSEVEERVGIRNRATALQLILSVFEQHKDELGLKAVAKHK